MGGRYARAEEATQRGGREALVARLAHPPPLEKLKELQRDITGIVGIPATVPARKHFRDKQL